MNVSFLLLWMIFNYVHGGLYDKNDNVALLNNDNFYELVLKKEHAWIIQFYNTWCGHCQHFAPLYKKIALDIKEWKDTVKVGVIDCAEAKNSAICRDYEVNGYPTVEVFAANLKKGDLGLPMPYNLGGRDVESIEKFILNTLTEKQADGYGSMSWSNLQYFKGIIADAINVASQSSQTTVVIFEPSNSIVGRQVILDLHYLKQMNIVRIKKDDDSMSAEIFYGDGKRKTLISKNVDRERLKESIASHLQVSLNESFGSSTFDESVSVKDVAMVSASTKGFIQEVSSLDQVYLIDIENALAYIFRHEFILHKTIEGHNLIALIDFVEVLYSCLPARLPVQQFMENFYHFAADETSLKGENLPAIYDSLTSETSALPKQRQWVGCLGSQERYRGFPCGLWTMFHALTVSPCLAKSFGRKMMPIDVLEGIHGFVKYSFSCRECSRHFQEMFATDAREYVSDGDDAIGWLWMAHNRVNHRLQNVISEDPLHKKIPFPARLKCPQCWYEDDQFKEVEVLKYLKDIYSRRSLSMWGISNDTLLMESETVYKRFLSYYSWYAFGSMYLMFSAFLIICFILIMTGFKRKQNFNYRYHVL